MDGALAVMMVVIVAHCGAVPTSSPSQEDLSKAQVNTRCSLCANIRFSLRLCKISTHSNDTIEIHTFKFCSMKRKRVSSVDRNINFKALQQTFGSALRLN